MFLANLIPIKSQISSLQQFLLGIGGKTGGGCIGLKSGGQKGGCGGNGSIQGWQGLWHGGHVCHELQGLPWQGELQDDLKFCPQLQFLWNGL